MLVTITFLSAVGATGAALLYMASKKFHVEEDPRIGEVQEVLPGANCGGCGFPGCAGFAAACAGASDLENLYCPVGGSETMCKVAEVLGMVAGKAEPMIAVVRCNGHCQARPRTNVFDGYSSCAVASALYAGETGCSWGCHGLGDCVKVCDFDAIHINPLTKLPEVVEDKCTACGACVKACPKNIIELRKRGPKGRRIFVSCVNKDKGGLAKKACQNACIGCSLCFKECKFEAINIKDNLSYIDHSKCRLCKKCVSVCPTKAIHMLNFPVPKTPKEPSEKEPQATELPKMSMSSSKIETPKVKPSGMALTGTLLKREDKPAARP